MKFVIEINGHTPGKWFANVYAVDRFDTAPGQNKALLFGSTRGAGTLAGAVYNVLRSLRRQFRQDGEA